MKWPSIAAAAFVLAAAGITGPALALPDARRQAVVAAAPTSLLSVRYRHYRARHPVSEAARTADDGAIKPGKWEFATRLQTQAPPLPPSGAQATSRMAAAPAGGALKTTYTGCIDSEKAVPAALGPQCKLDSSERNGARITWSMICTNAENAVHSDGVAQYRGDTMEATLVSHLPSAKGVATDLTQHITGRYLGPCTNLAEGSQTRIVPPRHETAAANSLPGNPPRWVEPPATTAPEPSVAAIAPEQSAAPPAEPSAAAAAPDRGEVRHSRHPPHRRDYAYYRRWRGATWSGGGYGYNYGHPFGPSPYSAGGY